MYQSKQFFDRIKQETGLFKAHPEGDKSSPSQSGKGFRGHRGVTVRNG
jgi:hypothetical protein